MSEYQAKDRYRACTLNGGIIYQRDTEKAIADVVALHMSQGARPFIAYTYDTMPGLACPYTTWAWDGTGYVGTSHRSWGDFIKGELS